ncbi:MAG: hypothetical protein KKF50_02820 [Nanoarchaeota archaeon]|nr:hypothetical protein [Nanoarchaeota archaeon]
MEHIEHTNLEELAKEVADALCIGVKEFEIKTSEDWGLQRAGEISRYFENKGYDAPIFGRRDVDREANFPARYSVIVRNKKVD